MAKTLVGEGASLANRARKSKPAKYGTAAVAGVIAFEAITSSVGFGIHSQIDQAKSHLHIGVGKHDIRPLTLDARAVMFGSADAHVRTQNTGYFEINSHIPYVPKIKKSYLIPGTGQIVDLTARTRTITFVPSDASTIVEKHVSVDTPKVVFETSFVENQTKVRNSLPWLSSISDGESQIANGATGGYVPLDTNMFEGAFSDLDQYTYEVTANATQEQCVAKAWSQEEQAITMAYEDEGAKTVSFTPGMPSFVGPYPNAVAPTNLEEKELTNTTCTVATNAVDLSKDLNTNQLNPPLEAAGN